MGTQAAVEYVCRKNSVEELLLRLSVSQTGQLKPFEAVLHVKVTRGRAGFHGVGRPAQWHFLVGLRLYLFPLGLARWPESVAHPE